MTMFGPYEAVRELHHTGRSTVWLATLHSGDPNKQFIVKSVALTEAKHIGQERVELFLDRAKVQQKVASNGGQHWAPIHDLGSTEDGAYYATDQYTRSVRSLLLGKVRLNAESLYALVSAIVQGLVELDRVCERPHGNLKPDNVLLHTSEGSLYPEVFLSDPLPSQRVDPTASAAHDLRSLGELIYHLVMQQEFRHGMWPAQAGNDWSQLGKTGEGWRQLCNQLLDPSLAQNGPTLSRLADEGLADLLPKPPLLTKKRLSLAAGLLLVVAIALAIIPTTPPQESREFSPEDWKELCYFGHDWHLQLYQQFNDPRGLVGWPTDDRALGAAVDHLNAIRSESIECDPGVIANRPGENLKALGKTPPDSAKTPDAIRQTQMALQAVRELKKRLDRWALPDGSLPQEIGKLAETYGQRGWAQAQAYLLRLKDESHVPTDGRSVNLAQGIADVFEEYVPLREQGILANIEACHEQLALDRVAQPVPGESDEALNRYRHFAHRFLPPQNSTQNQQGYDLLIGIGQRAQTLLEAMETIETFDNHVDDVREQIAQQLEKLKSHPQIESFQEELTGRINRYQTILNQCLNQGDLAPLSQLSSDWERNLLAFTTEVDGFLDQEPSTTDPRHKQKRINEDLTSRIESQLNQLAQFQGDDYTQQLSQQLAVLKNRSSQITELPWVLRNKSTIEEGVASIEESLISTEREAVDHVAKLQQPLALQDDPRPALASQLQDIGQEIRRSMDAVRRIKSEIEATA